MPEPAAQSSAPLLCDYCDREFEPSGRGPLPRFCGRRCQRAWGRRKDKRRAQADQLAAAVPKMTGAQRELFEQYEQLLRMSVAIKGPRRRGDA